MSDKLNKNNFKENDKSTYSRDNIYEENNNNLNDLDINIDNILKENKEEVTAYIYIFILIKYFINIFQIIIHQPFLLGEDDQKEKLLTNDKEDQKGLLIINHKIKSKNSTKTLERHKYIEDLFEKIGYGRYQFISIIVAFFCIAIEGVHLTMMSSMIIPLEKYFNISNLGIELASGLIFIGVGVGTISLYYIVEKFDRTIVMKVSMFCITILQLATVFLNNIYSFTICRFLLGIGGTSAISSAQASCISSSDSKNGKV